MFTTLRVALLLLVTITLPHVGVNALSGAILRQYDLLASLGLLPDGTPIEDGLLEEDWWEGQDFLSREVDEPLIQPPQQQPPPKWPSQPQNPSQTTVAATAVKPKKKATMKSAAGATLPTACKNLQASRGRCKVYNKNILSFQRRHTIPERASE